MRAFQPLLTTVAGALALMGCATPQDEQLAGPVIRSVQSVRHGLDAHQLYLTGRYFQGQQRFDQAIAAYRELLALQPGHADAHSALGVVYSALDRPQQAEEEFKAALAARPDAAAHNNYGYHLMRNGRMTEALASFERASALEPGNALVVANLANARQLLGLVREAQAQAQPSPPAATPTQQVDVFPRSVAGAPVTSAAPAVLALQPVKPAPSAPDAGRIEIANGNGATGLAKRVWGLLAPMGLVPARLTNDKPYGTVTSRIQYVPGAQQAAQAVNASLPMRLPLVQVAGLERNARVRVLLGKDFPRQARAVAELPAAQTLAASDSAQRNTH